MHLLTSIKYGHFVSLTWHQKEPYTHIAQLMTHTTNAYIAASYLGIKLLSLLAYCRG